MSAAARMLGVARSVAMYYGIPLRARRLRRFYSHFVTRGSLCFDVGAHAGNRVRCWRRLGARVVAIEPQPDFVRLLTWLFGRDAGVEIVAKAVGARAGSAELFVSERTPTVTTMSREWIDGVQRDPRFGGVSWSPGVRVEVVTLDSLIATHGEPQFVKIDVEGFEAEVLAGLGRYRYNWSPGESHSMASERWVDGKEMRARIEELPPLASSGDVYAVRDET